MVSITSANLPTWNQAGLLGISLKSVLTIWKCYAIIYFTDSNVL